MRGWGEGEGAGGVGGERSGDGGGALKCMQPLQGHRLQQGPHPCHSHDNSNDDPSFHVDPFLLVGKSHTRRHANREVGPPGAAPEAPMTRSASNIWCVIWQRISPCQLIHVVV